VVRPRRISDFKPRLTNLAQTSHYQVQFGGLPTLLRKHLNVRGVDYRFLTETSGLLCNKASLPGSRLGTRAIVGNFMGVAENMAHSRIFSPIQLEFYVDNEYKSMNYDALIASIIVSKDDQFITEINPEKRLYHSSESPMTEAGINGRLDRDLYVSLGNMVSENKWSIRVYDKPLIRLIWIGTIFMILGATISIRFRKSRHYE